MQRATPALLRATRYAPRATRRQTSSALFSGGFERVLRSAPQFGVTLALYDVLTQYCTDHGWLG